MKHLILNNCIYFITTNTYNRIKFFKNEEACKTLLHCIDHYRKQLNFRVYGYMVMPDHLHILIGIGSDTCISNIMGYIKGGSGYEINKMLKRKGRFWQENYYDHVIRNRKDFKEKINYIHKNPFRAGLVRDSDDYKYSSYINYCGDNGLIDIDYPDFDVM